MRQCNRIALVVVGVVLLFCNQVQGADVDRDETELQVLTYNVQFRDPVADLVRPGWPNTKARAEDIGRAIACYDIIALQEAFRTDRLNEIIQAAEAAGTQCGKPSRLPSGRIFDIAVGPVPRVSFPSFPENIAERFVKGAYNLVDGLFQNDTGAKALTDSGLVLLSRYPIVRIDRTGYHARAGYDAWARKGALHAMIQLSDRRLSPSTIDVFVTHLQAGHYPATRISQVDELARFIRQTHTYSPETPVLLMGDFNIKGENDDSGEDGDVRSQYALLNTTLHQAIPKLSDVWSYHHPAYPGFTNAKRKKRIDYIFMTEGPEMRSRMIEVNEFPVATPLNRSEPAPKHPVARIKEDKDTLSDHAAVEAHIVWIPRAPATRLSQGS